MLTVFKKFHQCALLKSSSGWYGASALRWPLAIHPVQFSSVPQLCPTLSDPMDCSMPGFPVHHQLLEPTQTHVHWVVMPSNHLILCVHFSSHLQSFPESGSFPMNQFFISGSQSIGVSASASATHPLARNHLVSGRCSFLFGLWVTSQSDSSLTPSPWLYLDHLHPNSDSSAYLIFFFSFSHPSFAWSNVLPGFWEWQETLSLPLKWPVVHPVTGFHDFLSDLAWTSPITYYHSGNTGQPDPAHPVVLVGTLHLLVEHWLQDYPGSSQCLVLNTLRDLL